MIDARLRFRDDKRAQHRFYFIAAVLLLLVYNLPSGLVLYWTRSNVMSLVMWALSPVATPVEGDATVSGN